MITTDATGTGTTLRIFDPWPNTATEITTGGGGGDWISVGSEGVSFSNVSFDGGSGREVVDKKSKKRFVRILGFLFPKTFRTLFKPMSIQEFFYKTVNSAVNLKNLDKRIASYENLMLKAEKNGQDALVDRLSEQVDLIRKESVIYAAGIRKVLTEEQIIEFRGKTRRGYKLNLVWIKNFIRIIPEKVLKKKEKLDELKIFDDYAILFYDPNIDEPEKASSAKTKKEIEREKDPILFGVIKNVRKLYYIDDWKDKYCDLTMDQIVKKLGKAKSSENDLTDKVELTQE